MQRTSLLLAHHLDPGVDRQGRYRRITRPPCDIGRSGGPRRVVKNPGASQTCRLERVAGCGIIAPRRNSSAHLHPPRRAICDILRYPTTLMQHWFGSAKPSIIGCSPWTASAKLCHLAGLNSFARRAVTECPLLRAKQMQPEHQCKGRLIGRYWRWSEGSGLCFDKLDQFSFLGDGH